jgi:hypothetical protein
MDAGFCFSGWGASGLREMEGRKEKKKVEGGGDML